MLNTIREKSQGIYAWVIIGLIVFAFVLMGLGNHLADFGNNNIAAVVNGEKISWQVVDSIFERIKQEQGESLIAQNREQIKALKDEARKALVQRFALVSGSKKLGFRITEPQIIQYIRKDIPQFQENGKFSQEKFLQVLQQSSFSENALKEDLYKGMLLAQVQQGIMTSNFSLPSEISQVVSLLEQQRDFGYFNIPISSQKSSIKPTEEELKKYYNDNLEKFRVSEQVRLDYVQLSLKSLMRDLKVTDDDLKKYYDEHADMYLKPEQINARHILLTIPKTASELEIKKIEGKANLIYEKIKNGASFEKLAKMESQDLGSAKKGGDLGWFEKGDMIPEFEQVAFNLKKPLEVSKPVKTQYGFHVIQLNAHKDAYTKPLSEIKESVEDQFRRSKAEPLFAQKSEELANLAYENPTSLKLIAEQFNLKVESTENFPRQGGDQGITANPQVIKAAFSDEILKQKLNSGAISIDNESYVVFRLKDVVPSFIPDLAEVSYKATEQYVDLKAEEKIKFISALALKKIKEGIDPDKVAKEMGLKWEFYQNIARTSQSVEPFLMHNVFSIAHDKLVGASQKLHTQGFSSPNGDFTVLALYKVTMGTLDRVDKTVLDSYKNNLTSIKSELEYSLYASDLIKNAKIVLN